MEFTGQKVIAAPRQRVYDALHDSAVLRQAIPGCQVLNKVAENRYEATVALTIGPLQSTFFGTIHVYNEDPPAIYSLRAAASAGFSGNAMGDAHVALASIDDETTNLAYHVKATADGQLGALDSQQLDSAAQMLVAGFFSRLQMALDASRFVPAPAPTDAIAAPPRSFDPRHIEAADRRLDETANGAQSTLSDAPSRAIAGIVGAPQKRFESAGTSRISTAPAITDSLGETVRPARDASDDAETDAAAAYAPTPVIARDFGIRGDTYPAAPRHGRGSPLQIDVEPTRGGLTPWRWFLVLVGLGAIAALLTGKL